MELPNTLPLSLTPQTSVCGGKSECSSLRIKWSDGSVFPSQSFLASVASLVFDELDFWTLIFSDGRRAEEPDSEELMRALSGSGVSRLEFEGGCFRSCWTVEVCDHATVCLQLGDVGGAVTAIPVWLQALPTIPACLKVLRLPSCSSGQELEICHALVGLASACGDVEFAQLFRRGPGGELPIAQWSPLESAGKRLIGVNDDSLWGIDLIGTAGTVDPSKLAFVDHRRLPESVKLEEQFVAELEALLGARSPDWKQIGHKCELVVGGRARVSVCPIEISGSTSFRSPVPQDCILVIKPEPDRVAIEIDKTQPADLLALTVAHGVAHVMLGHVQPGDECGHWDTAETLMNGRRRWDLDVQNSFPEWFCSKKADLVDLTAREKAILGVWRMIQETLGEGTKLHRRAAEYQKAAYQRQAAERVIAQLDLYRGAMLCDGVGLGKTYIATTVMVHYANGWVKTRLEGSDASDLFRITVLAPNSVVSTWRREAIPPLYAYGVLPSSVRVISHSKLSRINSTSEVIMPSGASGLSDLEHLILSDLVIVDEAHNFRSSDARRSLVLRDLLRLQPRKSTERKVLLLTATPVNNSLDDLRQQAALMFSRRILLSNASSPDGYRRQALDEIQKRAKRARTSAADKGNVAALMIHGDGKTGFSKRLEFRDDLDFGTRVQRIGDYLNEQDRKLKAYQDEIRAEARAGNGGTTAPRAIRVADELLDRIVVQRSRNLCKEIERQAGSSTEILFRPDAGVAEKLYYSDEYDGIRDVLAGFLPLFARSADPDEGETTLKGIRPLSLKIYMWYDIREGFKDPSESSPVVGLQRALVLKRLESSPVSLLITLLRLTVFHAFRLRQLSELCLGVQDAGKVRQLKAQVTAILDSHALEALEKIRSLATGGSNGGAVSDFIERLAGSHQALRPVADTDDAPVQQLVLDLYGDGDLDGEKQLEREEVERLWGLKDALLDDFDTLLRVTPGLADIVFGKFERREWPRKFIAGGLEVDWPGSAAWGQRIVSDAKIRRLVTRLLEARRRGQKTIVFSQFTDSLAYIQSVLRACQRFTLKDWSIVVAGLGVPNLHAEEVKSLIGVMEVITGDTEDRDGVVNAFAPYYRIGPFPPALDGVGPIEAEQLLEDWKAAWQQAMIHPIDVLLATDVLAEGVNLQDAALLINFDVHWNPVRMIQRSGRVDRRLNPRIERLNESPALAAISQELGRPVPPYYWHGRPGEAPLTVNMILPDELERELLLRERIAIKTLAIDFTLGLDQGTGAEADWMASYKYQGISSLNAFQKDRAIEQIAGYHEKLTHNFTRRGVDTEWSNALNIWIRQKGGRSEYPLLARAAIGQKGGGIAPRLFSRHLTPAVYDGGACCWLWSEEKPRDSLLNQWLVLDSKSWPPRIETRLPWRESASSPITPHHLLVAIRALVEGWAEVELLPPGEVARPLQQGITAVSAGFFGDEEARTNVKIDHFFVLQLDSFEDQTLSA